MTNRLKNKVVLLTGGATGIGRECALAYGRDGATVAVLDRNFDEAKVTDNASFIDDLGADSLDTVELVMAFEEEFDIEIPDDAAEHIQTVGDAVKFIAERLGA